jgi:hypothetical protein
MTLTLTSNKQSRVLLQLNDLWAENRRSETNTQNKIEELRKDVLSAVNPKSKIQFNEVGLKCLDLAEEGERVATIQKILRSLNFKSIKARQFAIKEAHKRKFDWIFKEEDNDQKQRPRFLNWQGEGKGIFWVSGKAGSGKPTLMKLLCDHESTRTALQAWFGKGKLVIACYFFRSVGK